VRPGPVATIRLAGPGPARVSPFDSPGTTAPGHRRGPVLPVVSAAARTYPGIISYFTNKSRSLFAICSTSLFRPSPRKYALRRASATLPASRPICNAFSRLGPPQPGSRHGRALQAGSPMACPHGSGGPALCTVLCPGEVKRRTEIEQERACSSSPYFEFEGIFFFFSFRFLFVFVG